MRRFMLILTGALMLAGISLKSFGQETTADIQGSVSDGKAPLAGATVIALHTPTGTRYTTTSRKDGRYNLANVRVGGPYEIKTTYVGFKEEKQTGITLSLGQTFTADFVMQSSGELTEVVVSAGRQNKVFNNAHTGSQEIINRMQIERLPTISRSLQDFTKLSPSSNGLSFGGRNNLYNNVTVDGANFNNVFGLASTLGGQTSAQPISLDAIEQIQVNISPYDVRQGGFSGAGINSITRSGSNQFKGTVYTYLKSPGTQGYNVRTTKLSRQEFKYKQNGFAVGGPIIENKLFFFVSAEQERITQPASNFIASDAGHPYVPGSNISQANADTLNALRSFLISKYKYDPGAFQDYSYRTQSDKITAKIDWNVDRSNTFTIKYSYLKSLRDVSASTSGAIGGTRGPNVTAMPFQGSGYTINNNFNIIIAELNTRFSSSISNKLQVGYTALRDFRASLAGKDFPLVDIGNGIGQAYTSFGYEPFTYNNVLNTDVYQISDIFTLFKGAHEITIGTQDYYKKIKNGFAPNYEGLYRFNTLSDFYNSAMNGAATAASYQLQYAVTKDGSFPFAKIGAYELGFFAQDKWRASKTFTLTYGLRIDAPVFENKFESNPYVLGLTFRDGKTYDVGAKPGTNVLISPRVGFNWDVTGDKSTQLRGGIGLFSGPPPFVWISNQASNNGVQFGSFFNTVNPATGKPYVFSDNTNAYRPSGGANTSYNLVFTDKNFKYPRVMKASLAVDRKLPGDIIATLEGTYSKEVNAVNFQNVNLPSSGTSLQGSDNRTRYSSTRIYSGAGGATVTNPNISNAILMTNSSKGYAYTLTLQLQKSFKNLYLNAAYTYSKAKSLNDGGSIAASMWRDRPVSGDPNAFELGYANFYQPHRIIASASYRVEYAKFMATSVGLIFEAAPAGVGSYTYNGDINNDGTGGNNDLIYIPKNQSDIVLVPVNTGGGAVTDNRTSNQIWAQLNNFINQDPYLSSHRGSIAERNAAVLPFYKRLDINITQDFYVNTRKDRHTLRFTFDVINAGNMINKYWGTYKTFTQTSFLKYEGLVPSGADAGKPRYSFPYLDAGNQVPVTNSYTDNTSILSRWQAQIGIRYLFN